MRHFTVTVLTQTGSEEEVEKLLMPYHEFECTGIENEYVQDLDITEERRKDYDEATTMYAQMPDGTRIPYYLEDGRLNPIFWRVPTPEEKAKIGPIGGTGWGHRLRYTSQDWGDGRGHSTRVYHLPEGSEEIQVPVSSVMSFDEWVLKRTSSEPVAFNDVPRVTNDHKYGYVKLKADGTVDKIIARTNPNRKWDWYVIGGRWTGLWKENFNPNKDKNNYEPCHLCKGTGSREGSLPMLLTPPEGVDTTAPCCPYTTEDWAYPVKEGATGCNGCYGTGYKRKFERHYKPVEEDRLPASQVPRDKRTFAVVTPDGKWHGKGQMGWFGCHTLPEGMTEEEANAIFQKEFERLLDEHPDSIAVLVDCHI